MRTTKCLASELFALQDTTNLVTECLNLLPQGFTIWSILKSKTKDESIVVGLITINSVLR